VQPNFSIATSKAPDETRIYLRGELDLESAPVLDEAMVEAMQLGVPIVLDCAGLSYCDSFGIRTVLVAGLRAREGGVPVAIEHATGPARRVMEMSGVAEVITLG
jgi:anti-anti-sigma factor